MNLAVAVLRDKLLGLQHLGSMNALLSWDQQVNVPAKGYEARAQLMAHVSGLYHRNFTSSEFETVLMQAQEAMDRGELNEDESCIVRETLCDFVKSKKLPNEFVDELSLTCARAHDFWARARKNSDFGLFAPHLEKIVELKPDIVIATADGNPEQVVRKLEELHLPVFVIYPKIESQRTKAGGDPFSANNLSGERVSAISGSFIPQNYNFN